MQLTQAQLAQFREQGYVNVGQVFSDAELAAVGAEYDRLVRSEFQTLGNYEEGRYPYRAMLTFRSETLRRCINHSELLPMVAQLLGPDVRFWWDQGINKSPGALSYIPWHQDNGYSQGQAPEYLTTWLALDDSTPDNGGLFVIPGSHAAGYREHEPWGTAQYIVPDVDDTDAVPVNARAGEHIFFSTYLLHQTVGNRTADRQRRAWVMQFGRADARNLVTGELYDDRAWVVRDGEIVAEPWSERRFDLRANSSTANDGR